MNLTETIVTTLSQLTLFADVLMILGIGGLFFKPKGFVEIRKYIEKNGLWMAFGVALIATLGSLYFSEGAGFTPCTLCWYQRILMYPLSVILFLAALRRDKRIAIYVLSLSLIGLVIATYHYYVQTSGVEILPCSVIGYSASCSQNFFLRYGYITIPVMSASAFGLIALVMGMVFKENKKQA